MINPQIDRSRRDFVVKVAYTTPAIMTVAVLPRIASAGSSASGQANCNNGVGNGSDCDPRGLVDKPNLNNDDFGGVPGAPQRQGGSEQLTTKQHHE